MKRRLFAFLLLAAGLSWSCCSRDPESRNLSKYAENEYPEGCVFRSETPYEVADLLDPAPHAQIRNVVLMIGDGMGLEQVSAALVANRGKLHIAQMPFTGIARTYSANRLITDSGAAGTALATGHKTSNYVVGVDTAGHALASLMDIARESGRRTGVTVVCRLNDATPAAFCCHNVERDDAETIAADYPDCGVDFIAGGGLKYWCGRSDGRDLLSEMNAKGYHTCRTPEALAAATQLPLVAVLDSLELPPARKRGDLFREMVRKGLELLDNEQGFFLMVEGSCIDDWCHANRIDKAIEETLDFDRTAGDVLRWAAADGHTLVVVTADHATGGLTLLDGDLKQGEVKVNFSSTGHNGILVPVFAYGPGAEQFTGIYENNSLSRKIAQILNTKR